MAPEAWLICEREDLQIVAAATCTAEAAFPGGPANVTCDYCRPRKHPIQSLWAFPIDAFVRAVRPDIEDAIGMSLAPLLVDYPRVLDGTLPVASAVFDDVGTVSVVRELASSWDEIT